MVESDIYLLFPFRIRDPVCLLLITVELVPKEGIYPIDVIHSSSEMFKFGKTLDNISDLLKEVVTGLHPAPTSRSASVLSATTPHTIVVRLEASIVEGNYVG